MTLRQLQEENARLREAGKQLALVVDRVQAPFPASAAKGGILVKPADFPPGLIVDARVALAHWESAK